MNIPAHSKPVSALLPFAIAFIFLYCFLAFQFSYAQESQSIPLSFSQPLDAPYPIATGIPFPKGSLLSLNNLRVTDATGNEIPAQFKSLAKWPDGSHKSVLVILNAEPSASYSLQFGKNINRSDSKSDLSYTEDGQSMTVTTGPIRFSLNKKRFSLFAAVWSDTNADGIFQDSERIIDQPGEIFLIDDFEHTEYKSSLYPSPQYTIEEKGPIRTVIRISGKLQSQKGKNLTDFIVRIYAYSGKDFVQMEYTLVDTREEKNVSENRSKLALSVTGYGIRIPYRMVQPGYSFGGEDGIYWGPLKKDTYLFQDGRMNYIDGDPLPFDFHYEGVGTGKKAHGWFDVKSPSSGISIAVKNFWQQFPKELALEKNQMVVYLHPPRASHPDRKISAPAPDKKDKRYTRPDTFYFSREGGAKTYQMLIRFHRSSESPIQPEILNRIFQGNPRLIAPASWYARSKVFGDWIEAGPWSEGYDRSMIDDIYQRSIEETRNSGGLAVLYGWRDFGDRMRPGWAGESHGIRFPSFYNDTHVGAHNFFIQYLRTLDNRWWELGEIASRHWMDIDVSHTHRWGYRKKKGKFVSFGPGEGHMIGHEVVDHNCKALHLGHAHISGLPDYYLLTGDPRALEVIREVGDWWTNAAPVFFSTPVGNPHQAEAERDFAWPLYVMCEAFRATGDTKYLQAAAQEIKHLIAWWQTPSDHYVNGKKVGRNDWKKGTGWWYMYPGQDNSPQAAGKILYNGTNPWMAGALLSAVIGFYEIDKDFHYADDPAIQEMLLQTMNYVVKYGCAPTKDPDKPCPYFVYAEANTGTDGGSSHLLFPLAYLGTLFRESGPAHPEWYDTAPEWLPIARRSYQHSKIVKPRSSTSAGFYGYEMIYPADFWKVMAQDEIKNTRNSP